MFLSGPHDIKPREEKYVWTHHVRQKMRYYRLTESRIKRIIRHPARIEEGIVGGAVACMQPAEGKNYSEIWTLYILVGGKKSPASAAGAAPADAIALADKPAGKIKIISAWRYPGKSPERDPVPQEILREIRVLIR